MMKKTTIFLASAMLAMSSIAQTVEIGTKYGTAHGRGIEVDLNNDGHLDILLGGLGRDKHYVEDPDGNEVETEKHTWVLFWNPATKKFDEVKTNILNGERACYDIADFDGDGIMDVALTDHRGPAFYNPGIYKGKGDGTFEKMTMTFDNEVYQFRPVALATADFNNDGLVDIVAIGNETIDGEKSNYNAILINKGDYHFAVTNVELFSDYELALCFVKVLDFNNDGYMDFMVQGNRDNFHPSGSHMSFGELFANLGADGPGEFYPMDMASQVKMKGIGGLDIADLNGDGYLDFITHGEGYNTGEPADNSYTCLSNVAINNKNETFSKKTQASFSADLRTLSSTGGGTRVIDWNGDGHYDLFIPGWNPAPETETQAGFFWLNDGAANFGTKTRVPGGSETTILFPDWNGDGIRDYMMSGQSWDKQYFPTDEQQGRVTAILLNERTKVNQRPTAPTGLNASINKNKVELSWAAATDAETPAAALSYEFYIKKDGKVYNSCLSHIGGALDGTRKVLALGNAMLNKKITLNDLPDGSYEWGVQAIDASYDGSTFATGSTFVIGDNSVTKNTVDHLFNLYTQKDRVVFSAQQEASIEIFSTIGTLINTYDKTSSFSASMAKGIYIVKVTIDNGSSVRQISVQ